MKTSLKKFLEKSHPALFFKDKNNYCALVGQRCDYYIFVMKGGKAYWGEWMKGKDWNSFWDECVALDKNPKLMDKLIIQYNKFGKQREIK